ncbi:MEDS domain-containing protein [Actinoplanes sp. NPDC051859]|uniref:MEDS domain-containing protein n=1 Tax=Actinoplanes sp. NPDC051859 TaxID=3363909 RepID=UPI0037A10052
MATTTDSPRQRAGEHVCVAYDEPAAFDSAAREFLAAGIAAGEQLWYIAPTPAPRGWDFAPELVRLGDHYPEGAVIDPAAGVAAYAAATERAIAAGYRGLRIAAEATNLVRTPHQLAAFTRYEHLVDRYMRDAPFSALCGYNRGELGGAAVAELACLHPISDAPFRLFAVPGDVDAGLAGELDWSCRDLFDQALDRADLRPEGKELIIDARQLTFIDHNSLADLDAYARRRGVTAVLRTRRSVPARLTALLRLTALRVEHVR